MATKYNAKQIRTYYSGFIGGSEVARKATSAEVIRLARLQDRHAKIYNALQDNKKWHGIYYSPRKVASLQKQLKQTDSIIKKLRAKIKARK